MCFFGGLFGFFFWLVFVGWFGFVCVLVCVFFCFGFVKLVGGFCLLLFVVYGFSFWFVWRFSCL